MYVRAHVSSTTVEKNAITLRRIWRQCTGACHRASTPLRPASSSLPPFLVPSSLDRTCVQNANCFSASMSHALACDCSLAFFLSLFSLSLSLFFFPSLARSDINLFFPIYVVVVSVFLFPSRIPAMIPSLSPQTSSYRSLET